MHNKLWSQDKEGIHINLSINELIVLCHCLGSNNVYDKHQLRAQLILQDVSVLRHLIDECIGDAFCQQGIDKHGKPNALGYALEDLIDKLGEVQFSLE